MNEMERIPRDGIPGVAEAGEEAPEESPWGAGNNIPGIVAELGELKDGAVVFEEALARMFDRHPVSIQRAVQRGELPPPTRLLGRNAWTVGAILRHLEGRQEQAAKEKERIEKIIIGESKNLKGENNPIQKEIQKLKVELEKSGIEVAYHPEIFTTMEARQIQGQTEMTDASAAALILKSFIDTMYNKGV